jgi:hypothetical protein
MKATITTSQPSLTETWHLEVALQLKQSSPEVRRETVTEDDLADAKSEAWFHGCLRQGYPQQKLEDVPMRLCSVQSKEAGSWAGFGIEVTCPGGETHRREFALHSLQSAAARAAQRLIAEGVLRQNDLYYYKLFATPHPPGKFENPKVSGPFAMTTQARPLVSLAVPLATLAAVADRIGNTANDTYPVFYTEKAFRMAERYARKGAQSTPPVETGAVLLGSLCSCPESGEFFCVIADVLEARETEPTMFSLFYSSTSWAQIQAVVRARQAQPATCSQRIVGQAHGHNFRPSTEPPCEECGKVGDCSRTSVFVSANDLNWSKAVFSGQPWQLCHIFGFDARGNHQHGLFGLSGGFLVQRGFHLIPEFDAAAWPLAGKDS